MAAHGDVEGYEPTTVYEFTVKDLNGNDVSMEKYKGHVLIIVNIAADCALSEINHEEFELLHQTFAETKGLRILAFPCSQFAMDQQESRKDLVDFMSMNNSSYEVFDAVDVNGDNEHPLWKFLKNTQSGSCGDIGKEIMWNYTKFIVDKNGHPVERHGPMTNPANLLQYLEKYFE